MEEKSESKREMEEKLQRKKLEMKIWKEGEKNVWRIEKNCNKAGKCVGKQEKMKGERKDAVINEKKRRKEGKQNMRMGRRKKKKMCE